MPAAKRSLFAIRTLVFANLARQILLGQAMFKQEISIRFRLIKKVKVFSLQIFDKSHHSAVLFADALHNGFNLQRPARLLARRRRSPAINS